MSRKRAATLPPSAIVTVIQSGTGPEVQVTGIKPEHVDVALDWLAALWDRRGAPIPGPDTVPGGTTATPYVDDTCESEYRRPRRAGFR